MGSRAAQIDSTRNSRSSTANSTTDDVNRIIKSLNGFYDLVGHKPEENGTLAKMAAYLMAQGATPAMVSAALDRCVKECRYPVRLPDIAQRISGMEIPAIEAEMRAAWDTTIRFVEKYVGRSDESYGPEFGRYTAWGAPDPETGRPKHPARYPQLPQRILDVVRRTGGWRQYLNMTEEDQPFQQKRFFEEFVAWTATEPVAAKMTGLLEPKQLKQLTDGKAMESPQFGKSRVEAVLPKLARVMEPAPPKDSKQEQARLAAWLKQHPEIGARP